MPLPPALQRFVDEELARLPALAERVCRETAAALRMPAAGSPAASPAERMQRFDLAQALEQHSRRFAVAFVEALAARVRLHEDGAAHLPSTAAPLTLATAHGALTLVDDAAQNTDIEIARCAALIAAEAEWELRELQTFTSALAGMAHVSVRSNPLSPEAFALALWEAADALPQARGNPMLLRTASATLATALRLEFAAACTRLEAQGVQPSLYRTAVPSHAERGSVLGELLTPAASAPAAAAPAPGGSSAMLLAQLFDGIVEAGGLHPALRTLTGLVRQLATALVAREPKLLDNARHPLWQLLDRFAYQSVTHPNPGDPQLLAWVGLATERVAALQALPLHDGDDWAEAVAELDRYDAAQFNAQLQQAAGDITALRNTDTGQAGLDIASMDTVPAELLDSAAPPADADRAAGEWLDAQAAGGWYRVFLRGRWGAMRLLWHSPSRARWLFAAPWPQRNDAFNRDTLVRLRAEKLIRPLVERSLVVRSAEALRRRLSKR